MNEGEQNQNRSRNYDLENNKKKITRGSKFCDRIFDDNANRMLKNITLK